MNPTDGRRTHAAKQPGRSMALTTLGRVDDLLLKALVPMLEEVFEAHASMTDPIVLPEDAYNASRRQYHSTVLLDALASHRKPRWERLLGLTDADLYTPDLNFVFGEADASRGVAVFSLARLHTDDQERFVHRAATEAIHELAHTYGLGHCDDTRCVMWFSNTLQETDRKGTRFCATHAGALRQAFESKRR
jgi:archaemetzincin